MRDFLRFLDSYKFFIAFTVLQLICLSFILRESVFQRTILLSSINGVTGSAFELREDLYSYFSLRETNEMLLEENLKLIDNRPISFQMIDKEYAMINDTLFSRRYTFQYANVINSTKELLDNYVTLDKGRRHGVEPRMGVLSGMRLLGRVEKVTENYSLVVPVIHRNFKVSAKIPATGHFGVLSWSGEDYRYAQLNQIPKEAKVQVGQIVVTRGAGSLFPPNIEIGEISDVDLESGSDFYILEVELNVDMARLNKVLLVKDLRAQELDSLENVFPR